MSQPVAAANALTLLDGPVPTSVHARSSPADLSSAATFAESHRPATVNAP
jgi:hypothetical protein